MYALKIMSKAKYHFAL